jgi:hypothetical protein
VPPYDLLRTKAQKVAEKTRTVLVHFSAGGQPTTGHPADRHHLDAASGRPAGHVEISRGSFSSSEKMNRRRSPSIIKAGEEKEENEKKREEKEENEDAAPEANSSRCPPPRLEASRRL